MNEYPDGNLLENNPSLDQIWDSFIKRTEIIMKNNYEKLSIKQNDKEDWTMNQIKRKQYESKNLIIRETKSISGGLAGVRDRFMELGRSYEQHLVMKNSKK